LGRIYVLVPAIWAGLLTSSTTNPRVATTSQQHPVEDNTVPAHVPGMTKTRSTYRIEQVRAQDLTDADVAMINGRWREIVDVHQADKDGSWDEVRTAYGEESVRYLIRRHGEDGPVGQVLVRFFLAGESKSGGIDDDFILLDTVALVDVQVAKETEGIVTDLSRTEMTASPTTTSPVQSVDEAACYNRRCPNALWYGGTGWRHRRRTECHYQASPSEPEAPTEPRVKANLPAEMAPEVANAIKDIRGTAYYIAARYGSSGEVSAPDQTAQEDS